MRFADREEAGVRLGAALAAYRHPTPVVIGLARGGVPVAAAAARTLDAPLDLRVVRKLGVPSQPELGFGAIAEGGGRTIDPRLLQATRTSACAAAEVERREDALLRERIARYRAEHRRLPLAGRTVIVVDDGIATGGTVRAALEAVRHESPARIVLAVPVAPPSVLATLSPLVDAVVCLQAREDLGSVGAWYHDFAQTSDDEVLAHLHASRRNAQRLRRLPANRS